MTMHGVDKIARERTNRAVESDPSRLDASAFERVGGPPEPDVSDDAGATVPSRPLDVARVGGPDGQLPLRPTLKVGEFKADVSEVSGLAGIMGALGGLL